MRYPYTVEKNACLNVYGALDNYTCRKIFVCNYVVMVSVVATVACR